MRERRHLFIDGSWIAPEDGGSFPVISPSTEETIGVGPAGSAADIDKAVTAARRAFDEGPWPFTPPAERAAVLRRMAAYLREQATEIAGLLCDEMGAPIGHLLRGGGRIPSVLDYYADLAEKWPFEDPREGALGSAIVRYEPVGVVGAITPWNGPLFILALKIAPALAAGCTIVAKPSPETPLDAFFMAEAAEKAGLPPGVLNIVPGDRDVGEYLVRHPGVDKIAFTGSTRAGRIIGGICGEQLKRCSLELGGKSAAVMLEDGDVETLVQYAVPLGLAMNNGQACAALTRIVVPRSRHDQVVEAMSAAVGRLNVGDPRDPQTHIGPLVSERQRERVEGYIAAGRDEGAIVAFGGARPAGLRKGWYVQPTVFGNVSNDMKIAREEIFGPVASIIPYDGGDDVAVRIANESEYGLGGAVFSQDEERGYRVAARIRTGIIGVNSFGVDIELPFGGFKNSGIGREMGREGMLSFIEYKSVTGVRGR